MKQVKLDLFNALKNRTTLGAVHPGWPPSNSKLPCTAYYQVGGASVGIADGKMYGYNELYSVDLFASTMTETEDMALVIQETMDTLPYIVTLEGNLDLYEEDTKVFHKVLRYRIKSY